MDLELIQYEVYIVPWNTPGKLLCVLVFFYSYEYYVLNKLTYKERGDKFLEKLWCCVSGRV